MSIYTRLYDEYKEEKGVQSRMENSINDNKAKLCELNEDIKYASTMIMIMENASKNSRDQVKQHLEKIVTEALRFVTQSNDYEFVIQDKGGTKPSYDIYVKSIVNGVECLQKPEDSCGGGFIDIISTTLKFAYLELFDDPHIMNNVVFLDEPGKMVSETMSVKFAEFIKFLGTMFNKKIIMITHNNNISDTSDNIIFVDKGPDGYSNVSDKIIDFGNEIALKNVQNVLQMEGVENGTYDIL